MADSKTAAINPTLKMVLELGPVLAFVVSYNFGDRIIDAFGLTGTLSKPLFVATLVLMILTPISILISWFLTRSLPAMPMITLVVVTIFGGLTLYIGDGLFIKIKPTIINLIYASVLLGGLAFGRSFLKLLMDTAFQIDDAGWKKLTLRFAMFFIFLAIVNEVVWRNFSEGFWVGFKFWGMISLTMLFIMSQAPMIMKHQLPDADEEKA